MLSRVRAILRDSSTGYFADTELYDFIDSGQNKVIQLGLTKELMGRKANYKSPVLTPLITLDTSNTTTVGASYQEYTLPSDFLAINYAEYSTSNAGTKYACSIVDFNEALIRGKNAYANSITAPMIYVRAEKIGFMPQASGAGANNYIHYYYKQPAIVTSSQDFTLREEAHESIEEWALYQAYQEKQEYDKAQMHLNNFIIGISDLC